MPARVLVVDDEPDVLDLLRVRLLLEGYIVETTTTGTAAIAAVRERAPEVVLLDLNMPGVLDGRAVLQVIHTTVAVIVLTAVSDSRDARATLQAGAFDFIAKPFDLHHISDRVAAAVAYRTAVDPRLRPSPAGRNNTAVRPDAHRPRLQNRGLLWETDLPAPPAPTS